MSESIFDVSENAWEEKPVAIKEFTDREDPQEAFERKVRVLHENWKKTYYVLCYYGIGGIGKTSFVNKLCRLIRGVEGNQLRLLDKIDCDYFRYDFDAKTSGVDKLSILLSFRKQLGAINKKFKFYRFDSALLLYVKRTGGNLEKDETAKSLVESSPWLDIIFNVVGIIPIPEVSLISSIIQAFDKTANVVKASMAKYIDEKQYRAHLKEIDGKEPPELLNMLHDYFISDMRYNMQNVATRPLIIFMDTYEKYIDTLNDEISMITEDHWLRKGPQTSVIRSIPGILWVITGREKLYWGEDDRWDEIKAEGPLSDMLETEKEELAKTHLEQHLLGDLSPKDSTSFLKKAGITNDTLCKQLHNLTSGTPLFLDICVDSYHQMCQEGMKPNISDFGQNINQLISRYLSNMNEANREMSYFLACLGKWNNESVKQIAEAATKLRWYTYAKYKDFVKHSFIIRHEDGSYYMHDTVRMAVRENADSEIWEEICLLKLQNARENVEKNIATDLTNSLTEYVEILIQNKYTYDVYYENVLVIRKYFRRLKEGGNYRLLSSLAYDLLEEIGSSYRKTNLDYICRSEYGEALRLVGNLIPAMDVVYLLELGRQYPLEGNDDMDELEKCWTEHLIANVYDENGLHFEAIDIFEKVVEKRTRLLGKQHPDTLSAMNNLAVSYLSIGKTQKAIEMFEELYELRKELLGVNHPRTLSVMKNLALSYKDNGEMLNAINIQEELYERRKAVWGADYPDTVRAMKTLNSYQEMWEKKKELERKKQAYEQARESLGPKHPNMIDIMYALALSYNDNGEIKKAYEMSDEAEKLAKEILGIEHPTRLKICDTYLSYRVKYDQQKMLEDAIQNYEYAKTQYGPKHPEALDAVYNLSNEYGRNGFRDKSTGLLNRAMKLELEIANKPEKY